MEAVRHARAVQRGLKQLCALGDEEVAAWAREQRVDSELARNVRRMQREGSEVNEAKACGPPALAAQLQLPVVNFAAGGIAHAS